MMAVQHIDNRARVIPYAAAFVAQERGVIWDRIAWAWRMQDGHGNSSTHDTWSAAQAELQALESIPDPVAVVTWADDDLSTLFGYKAPRKARKRKGKRK